MRTKRVFTDEFKAKVALEAVKETKTVAAIAEQYKVHPTQVSEWKDQLLANASTIFNKKADPRIKQFEHEKDTMLKIMGEKDIENAWLKKKCRELGLI